MRKLKLINFFINESKVIHCQLKSLLSLESIWLTFIPKEIIKKINKRYQVVHILCWSSLLCKQILNKLV